MVKTRRKMAERIVPLRLLSKPNLTFPVKKIVFNSMMAVLMPRKITAPIGPGMPPFPSGGGAESSTAPPAAGAGVEPPMRGPRMTGPVSVLANFSTMPGLWIVFHSSVASIPAYAMMACSPPGCTGIHFVTSSTCPLTTIQQSSFLLCWATVARSAKPDGAAAPPPPPPPAGAAPVLSFPLLTKYFMFFSTVPGLWIVFHSSVASCPT
mmetsp:Transcript_14612/g.31968  ORF Transcript_14612/g.31968 Transcript_14612/m.31968 type:complete len:208 (+) Transcript_14612:786-1409(+)